MKQLNLKLIHSDNKKIKETDYLLILENIHNHIYANDGLSANESLDLIINILFIKYYDEVKNQKHFYITSEEHIELLNGKKNNNFIKQYLSNIYNKSMNGIFLSGNSGPWFL